MNTLRPELRPTTAHSDYSRPSDGLGRVRLIRTVLPLTAILLAVGCSDSCGGASKCSSVTPAGDAGSDAGPDAGPGSDSTSASTVSPPTGDSDSASDEDSTVTTTDEATTQISTPDASDTSASTEADASAQTDTATQSDPSTQPASTDPTGGGSSETETSTSDNPSTTPSADTSSVDTAATSSDAPSTDVTDTAGGEPTGGGTGPVSDDTTGPEVPDTEGNAYPTSEALTNDAGASEPIVEVGDGGHTVVLSCEEGGATRATLPIDSTGWVPAECNDAIQGGWYCYDDGINESGCPNTQPPFDAQQSGMCLNGDTIEDLDFMAWGAGIGLPLNDSPYGKQPWNAQARNIIGFKFVITGDAGSVPLRVNFTNSPSDTDTPPTAELPGVGTYSVLFEDALVPYWAYENADEPTDPTAIYDVQLFVVGGMVNDSYDICLTELSPIYGD